MSSILGSITSTVGVGKRDHAEPDLVALDAENLGFAEGADAPAAAAPSRYPAGYGRAS